MPSFTDIISLDNPLYRTYIIHTTVLGAKMLLMSPLTGRLRIRNKAFANPEDVSVAPGGEVKVNDDVERVRRAHLNDLENIPVFMVVSGLYLLTNPCENLALQLFRAYTAARIAHTVVYAVCVVPQPARGIAWGVGYGITAYMAVKVILAFKSSF